MDKGGRVVVADVRATTWQLKVLVIEEIVSLLRVKQTTDLRAIYRGKFNFHWLLLLAEQKFRFVNRNLVVRLLLLRNLSLQCESS